MTLSRNAPTDLDDVEIAIDRWGDTVLRLTMARLRNRADAEDAFQNTFLAYCRTHPTFTSAEHQKAWLLRTACNCATDIHRTHVRSREFTLGNTIDAIADDANGVTTDTFAHDDTLAEALDRLTDRQRTVIHLYYYEGYSTDDIAQITGEKPATVRSHLFRARRALKIELTTGERSL